nr:HsdR family type I site-specific deoxyribonuclease [Chlorobium phaeobacteroides]
SARNVYEVTEEWAFHNGHYGTREDVVFLINGIPVLVIECKNASKDEAIALGIDQIRRYHRETPELFVPQQLFTATDAIGFSYGATWNTVRRNIFEWKILGGGHSCPPLHSELESGHSCPPLHSELESGLSSPPLHSDTAIGLSNPPLHLKDAEENGGQECPPSFDVEENGGLENPPSFLDPEREIGMTQHRLPHWQQGDVWVFVTWRLADSLPQSKLEEWKEEREIWLSNHPEPWDEKTEEEYHERFSRQIDEWLDQGSGSCLLREPAYAQIVANALRHFDGERYQLASFVVMPNHVHVLFCPSGTHSLAGILKSWKGFSAREINKRSGKTGSFWQEEYWDRLIRSEKHFFRVAKYIRENPIKGGGLSSPPLHSDFERGLENPPLHSDVNVGLSNPPFYYECELLFGKNGGQECPPSVPGRLESKVKTFCAIPQVLAFLKEYIVFAEKDEELNKYILRQHQTGAVDASVNRALDPVRSRGLVWHTQGSGKTFTMIKAAERLFRAPEAEKPTILLMIDRNELEDQMLKNLAALGLGNLEHASSIARLNKLLKYDYRGIIVTMIHKFRDMPGNINTRSNIYVLIDEAHRTTGGDLGNYLMAGLPNATFIGFTGTPVDKTVYGRGTFKTFGCEDDKGYLHKYSIADSIEDGTTLPLYYQLAPNDMLVPHETLDAEFLSLAEAEGVADIEELNKILDRAVNLKNFLKGRERIEKVAQFVAGHYLANVEPLGYKAFLVGVDREACAHYKQALDQFLPSDYSRVVYTGNNNDSVLLKKFHLDQKQERQIRKSFGKIDQQPKILIVTEKLLTGFDAPLLYAMYLDKPMRDHTLLQAIARVNRPYENEAQEMVKPHGFVLDFVGIFDKLEKALAFDSKEINAIVKDIKLLKMLFQNKMEAIGGRTFLSAIGVQTADIRNGHWISNEDSECNGGLESHEDKCNGGLESPPPFTFNDRDVDNLIEHFRDPERRKAFFKEYKEIEMLYEIISPDAFLRPFIERYATLSAVYDVVRKAYAKRIQVDRDFQRKTNLLVQEKVGSYGVGELQGVVKIDSNAIDIINAQAGGAPTRVINLIKSIEKIADDQSDDLFLIAMAERAQAVQESFESRQVTTAEALEQLMQAVEVNEERKKEQAAKGFDGLTFFVYRTLLDEKIEHAEEVSRQIKTAFVEFPNWQKSEAALRELRKKITFAIFAQSDDLERVTGIVDYLFRLLERANRI